MSTLDILLSGSDEEWYKLLSELKESKNKWQI
jgi:hypothetical protein